MKKILYTILITSLLMPLFAQKAHCYNFGMYKTDTEYGLIDGFKWKLWGREKGEPVVQLKSETKEEQIRLEKAKNKPKEEQDDVQLFRFMIDEVNAF